MSLAICFAIIMSYQAQAADMMCTMEYAPVCWETPPKVCLSLDCAVHQETYSNKCMMENAGSKFLYEGECKTELPEATDTKYYVWDTQQCMLMKYTCDTWYNYFSDTIGCGCEKDLISQEVKDRIDTLLEDFIEKLSDKWYSKEVIQRVLARVGNRLEDMRDENPKYEWIIRYFLKRIDAY